MPTQADYREITVFEDTPVTFLERVTVDVSSVETNVQQSHLDSITWAVYDGTTEVGSGTLTVADVIFNSLQTGSIWEQDTTGFNFKAQLAGTNFPTANKTYKVIFAFTRTGASQSFPLVWLVKTLKRPGS